MATNPTSSFSVDDAVAAAGFGRFQVFLLVVCGLVWAADAMELMLLSFLLPEARKEWGLSRNVEASIGAATFAGVALGAYLCGTLSDRYGRRTVISVSCAVTGVLGFASSFAPDPYSLMVLRAVVGLGLGGAPVAFALFVEFLPASGRGKPLVLMQSMWTVGTLGEAGLAWIILPLDSPWLGWANWRWLLVLTSAPVLVLAVLVHWLPESPRFLVSKGRTVDAKATLHHMCSTNRRSLPDGELEGLVIEKSPRIHGFMANCMLGLRNSNLWVLFGKTLLRTTACLWVIWFVNSFVYYGIVLFTPEYFESRFGDGDLENGNVYADIFLTSSAELPGLIASGVLVDLIGRKRTQALLFFGCALFIGGLVLPVYDSQAIALGFAFGARACIAGSFVSTYVYTPEAYPTIVRTTGLGAAAAVAKVASIATPYVSNVLIGVDLALPISIYAISCTVAVVASMLLPFETGSRSLVDTLDLTESGGRPKPADDRGHEQVALLDDNDDRPDANGYGTVPLED